MKMAPLMGFKIANRNGDKVSFVQETSNLARLCHDIEACKSDIPYLCSEVTLKCLVYGDAINICIIYKPNHLVTK